MIKFRAWEDRGKEYIKDVLIGSDGKIYFDDGVATQDDLDISVEQSTGLKDKNNKEIYEGDIIKSSYKYAQPKVSQIVIEDGNSYILGEDLATGKEMLVSDHVDEIEVIGNVHTTPELLEESK
ncbi:YopX family protein [Lactiplantibacillus argentoratensis]|uniref:YopX family protein n=1 Tax=Lactiplantibacillus argentoratensis TaxID=271881 RepID=UPI003EB6C43F